MRVVPIVEGHGEVSAVPILIRRVAHSLGLDRQPEILRPIRIPRQRLLRTGELERAVELAARQTEPTDGVLILMDANSDCPAELAPRVLTRATAARPDRRIRLILPKVEYEAWFLAAASSLAGQRGLDANIEPPPAPERIRDPKGWLTARMAAGRSYRETLDQPALTASFDLHQAKTAESFGKLWRDLESLLL